ncbi:MAG: BON domain-containing protein [Agarilytica sp.]
MMTRIFQVTLILLIVNWVSGCSTVVEATTDEPIQVDPGKRSFGEYIDDNRLETIIKVNIKKASPKLKKAHVNVHSYNGVILLTGEVFTHDLRTLAGDTARQVNKVRQVNNELTVGPKTGFLSRANDSWIETRINSKLLFHTDIESRRVDVIVEDNVVYLMGKLTRAQLDRITDVVRTTKGVKKVIRAVEYLD